MFAFYNRHNNNLYNKLVNLSRNIFFYKDLNLKDNFETRVLLIFFHLSIILIILKSRKGAKLPQKIYDNIFQNIEYHLRELGHGDVSVNSKMKALNNIFYDILLKVQKNGKGSFDVQNSIIEKYFLDTKDKKNEITGKLANYFVSFYNFCFVIDDKSMLEGVINYNK